MNPLKNITAHSNEIIDFFWLFSSNKYFLSSSTNMVILWNLNQINKNIYKVKNNRHIHKISCLAVNTNIQNMFATGNSYQFVRLWQINKTILNNSALYLQKIGIYEEINEDIIKEFYVEDNIKSLNFLQEGDKIIIGTNKGKILIYKIIPEINFEFKIECRNRFVKSITNINFFLYLHALYHH